MLMGISIKTAAMLPKGSTNSESCAGNQLAFYDEDSSAAVPEP